jgi:hypothetical protein
VWGATQVFEDYPVAKSKADEYRADSAIRIGLSSAHGDCGGRRNALSQPREHFDLHALPSGDSLQGTPIGDPCES